MKGPSVSRLWEAQIVGHLFRTWVCCIYSVHIVCHPISFVQRQAYTVNSIFVVFNIRQLQTSNQILHELQSNKFCIMPVNFHDSSECFEKIWWVILMWKFNAWWIANLVVQLKLLSIQSCHSALFWAKNLKLTFSWVDTAINSWNSVKNLYNFSCIEMLLSQWRGLL